MPEVAVVGSPGHDPGRLAIGVIGSIGKVLAVNNDGGAEGKGGVPAPFHDEDKRDKL